MLLTMGYLTIRIHSFSELEKKVTIRKVISDREQGKVYERDYQTVDDQLEKYNKGAYVSAITLEGKLIWTKN